MYKKTRVKRYGIVGWRRYWAVTIPAERQCYRTSVNVLKGGYGMGRLCEYVDALSFLTSVRFISLLLKSLYHPFSQSYFCRFHHYKLVFNDNEHDCISAVNNSNSFIIKTTNTIWGANGIKLYNMKRKHSRYRLRTRFDFLYVVIRFFF